MERYDLFNEALDDLAGNISQITGLLVVTDPAAINPPCVLIGAPSFEGWSGAIAKMNFPLTLVGSGPGSREALRNLLGMAALLLNRNVGVTGGRPRTIALGGGEYPAYDLDVFMQAQGR